MRILLTGSSGFVGSRIAARVSQDHANELIAVLRHSSSLEVPSAVIHRVGAIDESTNWEHALADVDVVIHSAARVHVMEEESADPLAEFRRVNLGGTMNLAQQAMVAGVRRFVFLSSIKVNGEATAPGKRFSASDSPAPSDPYAQSKFEAEMALIQLGRESSMEIVILRPPLVYGPGVKANFLNLLRLIKLGVPLPLGCAHGRRSMVALDNLVDLVMLCCSHPNAAGRTFMVSDGVDLSVRELISCIAGSMRRRIVLLPVPVALLQVVAHMIGRKKAIDRLVGSLQVDISDTYSALGWIPNITPQQGIEQTVSHFLENKC